ncbi:hypothetical protein P7C71_g2636, partial [Lecanoromycetidae sp. Uapishka_2]
MGFFSKFKSKDRDGGVSTPKSKKTKNAHTNGAVPAPPPRPHWEDAWARKEVEPEEIQELLRGCTYEMKSRDSDMARDAFATFIPLSVESDARTKIIFDFFDLMAAIAAHGKTNGMGGRKLSRLAGWWAFEQVDAGNGFDGGYKSWSSAADATSHLFFAYLRSLSPDSVRGLNGISALPISLQNLVNETLYPPEYPTYESTSKVVMVVNSVSPTPFALLRRAKNFEYRDDDRTLQEFSNFEDPVQALTDECRRVLKSISSANQSTAFTTKASTSLGDSSWSRFEDMGFGSLGDLDEDEPDSALGSKQKGPPQGLRSAPGTKTNDMGRPTTPSWADFLSSGFVEENNKPAPAPLFLPPDKILPPIDIDRRGQSSQSHRRMTDDSNLEPGELASINAIELDDAFWWVWITSLAGEETPARKATFGRCALIETKIGGGSWLVVEEMVKGAAPEPEAGAYIAEKKGRFTFRNKNKMTRTKSMGRKTPPPGSIQPFIRENQAILPSKTNIGPDQHARIQAAAAVLQQKQRQQENGQVPLRTSPRRGRQGDAQSTKTNSVFTLQPVIMSEASPAMKWANDYDKKAIRAQYLGNNFTGKGSSTDLDTPRIYDNGTQGSVTPQPVKSGAAVPDYGFPKQLPREDSGVDTNRTLPALPAETPGERTLQAPTGPPPEVSAPPAPLPITPQMPMGPPPPAPLPVEAQAQPGANAVASDAAEVPLPAATPMEVSEKPLPTPEGDELEPTRTITNIQTNGVESPESTKAGKKLKKQPGGGGFRIFGKKKGPAPPAQPAPADSAAVAAARAAYPGPTMKPNYQPANSLSRRLSGIGRRKTPPASTPTSPPIPDVGEPLPAPSAPFKDEYASQASLSRVDSNEQRQAEQEFKTFDQPHHQFTQGPIDQPAFVPQDSEGSRRPSFVADQSDGPSRPSTTDGARGPHFEPPIGRGQYEPSVSSREERPRTPSPPADRWAQIRANAAKRAERASEGQQSGDRMSQDKTEDGDESGEETIESRVARIKARVAELTGNMQSTEPHRA